MAAPGARAPGLEVRGATRDQPASVEVDYVDVKAHEQAVHAGTAGDEQALVRRQRRAQHESVQAAEKGGGDAQVERVRAAGCV